MDRRDRGRPEGAPQDRSRATDTVVSVVIPVLNEERHLRDAVSMVLAQDWPGRLQVVLAVGPSTDRTAEIAAGLAAADDRVLVVDNPTGRTPDALNAAIAAADGDVVVRVDGHAEIPADYVATAVRTLEETGADNVGGIMDAQGITAFQRAVAVAMRSPVGVGSSRFHVGGEAGPADTVYLGAFRRTALARVGGYDRRYARAQDWEMNHRIRQSGGLVWFTPQMRVTYRPRSTVKALAKQYFLYGRWRRVVARSHPGTINARYLAAPAMVVGVGGSTLVGLFWTPALAVPTAYALATAGAGLAISRDEDWSVRARMPGVLAVMHWAWGLGFISSPRSLPR
ncbi:MAG: glycosyltransferase family 2 protein [Dermatophilaceae bacterium]